MDEHTLVDLLEELVEALGPEIRYEPIRLDEELGTRPGGFCRFKGQPIVIINPGATLREKMKILTDAVKQFDLDGIYIRPALRELLDKAS
jgi:hypothetical protein